MGSKKLLLGSGLAIIPLIAAVPGFSQVQPAGSRIQQQVIINGQTVTAVNVIAPGGGFQSYTCTNPQQYSTPDGSSQGWACYQPSTGVWLLNALGPVQAQMPQPPAPQPQPQPVPQAQAPPAPLPQAPAPVPQVQQPVVIYQQPAPTVIYQQPPTVIYTSPVYGPPVYPAPPVIVAPAYPPSVVLGTAAIGAASRIISAAIIGSGYPRVYYAPVRPYPFRGWRR
jgi:hypothetical protein